MNKKLMTSLFLLAQDVVPVANSRIISAITYKGKVVGLGQNQKKSHPIAKELQDNKEKIYLHAEMAAILQAKYMMNDLTGCDIYIIRAKRDSKGLFIPGVSKPCDACKKLIEKENIRNIYCVEN